MAISYVLSGSSIMVVVDFSPKTIPSTHPNYERIKALASDPKSTEDDIRPLLDLPKAIVEFTGGKVYVKNNKLFLDGCEVRTSLGAKILEFIRAGDDALAEPLKLLLENTAQNPDPRAQADLFDWLQAAKLPITPDGYVLAWKAVRDDYRSIHAPNDVRFDHRVGNRVEQPRDECDADPNRTCSQGLHFCAASYLRHYAGGGTRIVVVKIHPKDVVSFPRDYNLAKGRACGYDVVGEVPYDEVGKFYPQGLQVYRGFEAVKVKTLGEDPVVGGVYRRRDGKAVVILDVQDRVAVDHNGVSYHDGGGLIEKIQFPLSAEDFHVGDRWVLRDGKVVTITHIDDMIVVGDGQAAVYLENGQAYRDKQSSEDFVFNLDYDRNKIRVGQVWRARNGAEVKITSVSEGGLYPVRGSNGSTYTAEGKMRADGTESAHDLVRRVFD